MLLNDLFKIAGEDGSIQQCINVVAAANAKAKYAVLIPANFTGTDPWSNPFNVPIIDLRAYPASTGLGGPLAGGVGPVGPAGVQGAPGSSNVPWLDAQNYGALPRQFSVSEETTTCTTTAGSPNVTLGNAKSFSNGTWVCIWKAGAVCAISGNPSAPSCATCGVLGAQTLNYQVVGVDALGGLTAASSAGQVTNAPAIFGNLAVPISSISITSGVCTVNFSSPINAVAGNTIHIINVGTITAANGIWVVASAPTTSSVTFATSAGNGTGTLTAASTGRLSNVQQITAISRAANGTITITTQNNHNFAATPSSGNPAIVIVEGCSPADLNGQFVINTASGNTITCLTGQLGAETGTVTLGTSTATCYEYVYITCPAYTTNTVAYYIYSDSFNPGGALQLIGKTMLGEMGFKDYGPTLMQTDLSGGVYNAPAYVPTAPPSSAQNQMWGGKILSGGGTTSLVMTTNVTTSLTSLSGTIMHDDGASLDCRVRCGQREHACVYVTAAIRAGVSAVHYQLSRHNSVQPRLYSRLLDRSQRNYHDGG